MRDGWVAIHRKIQDSWLWHLPHNQFKVAIRLIVDAAWEQTWIRYNGNPRILERGQVVLAERGMAETLGMSRKAVRLALSKLDKMGFVKLEKRAHFPTIVTIVNYCKYQNVQVQQGPTQGTTGVTTLGPVEQIQLPSVVVREEPSPGPVVGRRRKKPSDPVAAGDTDGDPRHRQFIGIFMGEYRKVYDASPAIVKSDHGALKRWLREHPNLTADEWRFKVNAAMRSASGFKAARSIMKICTSEVWNNLAPYAPGNGPGRESPREWKTPEEWGIPDEPQPAEQVGTVGSVGSIAVRPVAVASPETANQESIKLPACPEW